MSLENTVMFLDNVKERQLALDVLNVFGNNAISFDQFDDVSKSFFKLKDYNSSIKFGESGYAIASTPQQMYIIRHNLINVYNHNNQPEKALRYIRANEAVLETDIDRDFEKAFSLFLNNKKDEAAALLRSKLDEPNLTEEQRTKLEFNLGTYDMLDGNFQQGLKRFLLSGEKMKIWDHSTMFSQDDIDKNGFTRWDGTVTEGQNILIIAEAGIGDEIINVRFFNYLKELGMNPLWMTLTSRPDLAEFYRLNGIDAICGIKNIPQSFTNFVAVPSMHLPIFLNLEYKDLWRGPYLTNTNPDFDKKWNEQLQTTTGKKKIGIRWQGNPAYDQDLHRSIPLADIISSIPKDTYDLFSLQRDNGLEELEKFPDVVDLSSNLTTMNDLVSCIKELDIVITSCTSIAHIAGAMGKEVYVWVPISCYYVWCNSVKECPWYGDNMHVLYQAKPRIWNNCVEEQISLLK